MAINRWEKTAVRAALIVATLIACVPASEARIEEFYREITVDGRIYVFSTETRFGLYQESKDMGVAITRLGYGPNGETVVFEDAKAIELYNRKYGKTEAPPEEVETVDPKLPFNVQYRNPGLRFSFSKAEINLTSRLQVRYTHESFDDIRNPPTPLPSPLEDRDSFRIRRMRVKLDGWIYSKELTYELQWDLADTSGNQLLDANLDYDFTIGKKLLRLKAGQFKAPFNWQQLASSASFQLVDRSILDPIFAPGRQIGVQLWGQIGPDAYPDFVDWRFGVFNGNGRTTTANDNDDFEYVGRVSVSPWGSTGYTEANLEGYDLRVSLAGEYDNNDAIVRPATGVPIGTDVESFGASIVVKAFRSLFLYGQYHEGESENAAGLETDREGWLIQGGWLVTPRLEVGGRWASIDPDTDVDDNDQTEWRAGVSWYVDKHNWKLQADYGGTENEAAAPTTFRELRELRLQAQLIF